jgi:hypothetical protein
MILTEPRVPRADFTARTGWRFEPEGACRGDLCVPLPGPPGEWQEEWQDEWVDVPAVAERLGMPLLHDEAAGLWCLGPEALGRVLQTAEAPDLRLPDWRGEPFELSSLRGQKVLLLAWASW